MSGGNYIRGKIGMSLIAVAMEQLQVYTFLQSSDGEAFLNYLIKLKKLSLLCVILAKKR